MGKSLIVVESPAKAKTIEKFLGQRYSVVASMGHLRDLPKSQLGVDVEQGFAPKYITIRGRGEIVSHLRDRAKKASRVLLATDPDREGEAISWHLGTLLGLKADAQARITFHEITREAVRRALEAPRGIDQHLVDAQQARRILDRLVGYLLSPLLWRKVRGGLSAGRVQSVAVRLICDREAEVLAFQPQEYWTVTARLRQRGALFDARYRGDLASEADARAVIEDVSGHPFRVSKVVRRERHRNPAAPFTTASLQQEAARKLGFTVRRTMRLAQELYEGLEVAGQHTGLVTYIRTDSTRVAAEAVGAAETYVKRRWGADFSVPRTGQARAGAQDAHEAIRPTDVERTPESLSGVIGRDQLRLYRLIWERFVASQMAPAVLDTVSVDLSAGGGEPGDAVGPHGASRQAGAKGVHVFRATGSTVKFPGFMVLYVEGRDDPETPSKAGADEDDEARTLPELQERDRPALESIDPKQHFTEPPPRYTEAMLVRALEEKGIGRPSTYAPIIETIQQRGYVRKEERRFRPTELGTVVTDLLRDHFPMVVDVEFTAGMESELDRIESGELEWRSVVAAFYAPFAEKLRRAEEEIGHVELTAETTDEVCDVCHRPMVVKHGRFGAFLACSGYPECKATRPILQKIGVACPKCGNEHGGELVVRRSRKGRTFYGCHRYPECDFVSWDRPAGICPVCGSLTVERRGKQGGRWVQCTGEGCDFREGVGERHVVAASPPER